MLALRGDLPLSSLLRWLLETEQTDLSLAIPRQHLGQLASSDKELFQTFVFQFIVKSAEDFLSKQAAEVGSPKARDTATPKDREKDSRDKTSLEINDANFPALGRPRAGTTTVVPSASSQQGKRHIRRIAPTAIPFSEQLTLSSKFLKQLGDEKDGLEALPPVPGMTQYDSVVRL